MRTSRTRSTTALTSTETPRSSPRRHSAVFALVALALAGLMASWAGCASGNTQTASTGSPGGTGGTGGTGGAATTSTGGTGGTGGSSSQCAEGEKLCNAACVKIDDPAYGCGQTSCDACTTLPHATSTCAAGVCVFDSCDTGYKNCDGVDNNGCEVDVQTDVTQCGACGSPCVVPNATPNCVDGVCGVGTCNDGYVDCDGDSTNGCEAQPQVDPKNCGMCGNGCAPGEGCEDGVCGVYCAKGKANCDNDAQNGCETPLGTLTDCAFCGDACDPANAQASCDMNGVCTLDQCNMGFANCDQSSANGCEINTNTDAGNCGFCGNVCPSGPHSTAACENGGCKLNCDPGYADCDGNPTNGCEVHTDVDAANCGTCGHGCVVANGTAACEMGVCTVAQCNGGYADCDLSPTNGCEVNLQNNPNNCGTCGVGCMVQNGAPACVSGMCAVGTCGTGYGDCDGQVPNGCETNTGTDPANCGTCGNACKLPNAVQGCMGGSCTIASCSNGYANCNNQASDGCEVNTQNDPNNCGFCGNKCFVANGVAGCSNGQCTVASCNNGFADCNGLAQDGCEADTTKDPNNCGTCGTVCALACTGNVAGTTCGAGSCQITGCSGANFNIDGVCSNGCECKSSGTSSSCLSPSLLGSGTLQVGDTATFTGNLVPAGQEAYLTVTFTGNTSFSYHPHIKLTAGATEFAFDVLTTCAGGTLSCTIEGGSSTNRTDWEKFYTAGDPNDPNKFNPIPPVGTVIIHVYRRPGKPVTCNSYTLTATNSNAAI